MPNPNISNNDPTQIQVFNPKYKDGTVKFTGADTYAKGCILGLQKIAAGSVTPGSGNTSGSGGVTGFALAAPGGAKVGHYNLECVTAVTNGGIFKLVDPDGNIVANNLTLAAGSGVATTFIVGGLTFIVTDATDFAQGDKFDLEVEAVGQYMPYLKSAVDGREEPSAILPEALTATTASTYRRRVLVGGEICEDQISVDAGDTIDEALRQKLRHFAIIPVDAIPIDELDNQ